MACSQHFAINYKRFADLETLEEAQAIACSRSEANKAMTMKMLGLGLGSNVETIHHI
jgi:hypothetical protein